MFFDVKAFPTASYITRTLKDIGMLANNGRHLPLIMRAGELVRNELG